MQKPGGAACPDMEATETLIYMLAALAGVAGAWKTYRHWRQVL